MKETKFSERKGVQEGDQVVESLKRKGFPGERAQKNSDGTTLIPCSTERHTAATSPAQEITKRKKGKGEGTIPMEETAGERALQ